LTAAAALICGFMCNKIKQVRVARACKIVAALFYFIAHETRPTIK